MSRPGKMVLMFVLVLVAFAVGAAPTQASSDSFGVSLPFNTATDTIGSGQANFETSGAEDDYTFTLGASHQVVFDASSCPNGGWSGSAIHLALVDSGSSTVASTTGCGRLTTSSLAAGTYTLRVTQPDGATGTYALHAFVVPAPDAFSVTLPVNTATDTLGSGQADFETSVSEDDYTFTLGASHQVVFDASSCPNGGWSGSAVHLALVDSGSSTVASTTGCGRLTTSSLAAGTYTLRVTQPDGATGTYALHAFVVPAPDAFSVTLPVNTATDTLGSGQADFETSVSEDDYTFTLGATHKVAFYSSSCPNGGWSGQAVHLAVVDSGSSTVASTTGCGLFVTSSLAAGTYTLQVTQPDGATGAYALQMFLAPAPDAFGVTLPVNTATDTLGSGQGDLESEASEDDYTFTLGSSHAVEIDMTSCASGNVQWELDDSGGSSVASHGGGCGLYQTSSLSAGTYTLRFVPYFGLIGAYAVHLFVVPAPDAFSVTLPLDTATDTLGSGQADLETTASEDDYTFTLASARPIEVDTGSCAPGYLQWELDDSGGSSVTSHGGPCGQVQTSTLTAGTYTLRVVPYVGLTGAYRLAVAVPPANDDFANATTLTGASGSASGATGGATGESGEPHGFTATVWFKWRSFETTDEVFSGSVGAGQTSVSVFTGSAVGSLTQVSGQSNANPGPAAGFRARAGSVYYVQLEGLSPLTGSYSLSWAPSTAPPGGTLVAQGFDSRGPGADPTRTRVSIGPVSVDVTSGNVLLGIPGPSFPSPAGALGLSAAWNSLPSQDAPQRPVENATGGGACPVGTFTLSADWLTCHPLRDFSTGARSAPGFGSGFSLNLSSDSVPTQLIDHSALAPDPALSTSSGEPEDDATTDPALAQAMDFIEVVSGDGSSRMFTHKQGTNEWLPSEMSLQGSTAGPNQVLTGKDQTDGARVEKDPSPGSGAPTWTLIDPDGTTATFGPVGGDGKSRVWSVQEQAKASTAASSLARLEYTYTAGTSGTLFPTSITEQPSGRSLSLDWNDLDPTGCPAAILCVTGPDGQEWQYVGAGSGGTGGQLASVYDGTRAILALGWSSGNLVSVQSADDLDSSSASPGYNSAHEITIAYNPSTSVASTLTDHDLTVQGTAQSNNWTFSYTGLDLTTGANGCGAFSPTNFAHAGIAAAAYRTGCRQWTHVVENSASAWDYITDMAGQLMEAYQPTGHELYDYAPDGRLLWSEDADGQPTDYSYDGTTGQLTEMQAPDPDGSGPLGRPTTHYRYNESKIGTSTTAGPTMTGLKAEWFANETLSGIPTSTSWSKTSGGILDENWSTTGPTEIGSPSSDWSVRYSGDISLPTTGDYSFQLSIDDGAAVYIDDQLVTGDWNPGSLRTVTGDPTSGDPAYLTAGTHRIVVEYFQATGNSELHLSWEKPGDSSYSLIPYNQVAPSYGLQTSTVSPEGEVSYSHFADPIAAQPDYTEAGGSLRLVNSFTYDALGRIVTRVQPKGNAARTIDSAGDLGGTPNSLYETNYTYYADTATAAPPSGCPSGSTVNQAGQLETVSRTGYADQTSVYDAAGRVIAFTEGKGTTCSTYDPEGNLVSERVPGDSTISSCPSDSSATACYSYDPSGLRRTARTASGEVDLAYDEDGHVTHSTQKDASGTVFGEAAISYSGAGDPYKTTVAAGPLSSATNYTWQTDYDSAHRLNGAKIIDSSGGQQEEGDYSYDPAGNLIAQQGIDVGLGIYTMFAYDHDGNITAAETHHGTACGYPCSIPSDSSPYADYTYTHDQDGRITSQTLSGASLTTQTTDYTYDAASRLETATLPSGLVRTYHYDDDSNRTSIDEQPPGSSLATVATYSYSTGAQDRLSSIASGATTSYAYDTDGETLTYGTNTLTWNGHDQIATDDPTNSSSVAYIYDPLGRLQERATTGPTVDNEYIYTGTSDTPIMVTDGAGTITESDLSGPLGIRRINHGPPLVSGAATGNFDLNFPDGIGNNAGTINSSGTRTNTYTYDAFGTPDQSTPTNALTNRFLGKGGRSLDTQTGNILMGARPYDPNLGRFLSTDPVEGGSANLYDYANQDPLNSFDFDGTHAVPWPTDSSGSAKAAGAGVVLMTVVALCRQTVTHCSVGKDSGSPRHIVHQEEIDPVDPRNLKDKVGAIADRTGRSARQIKDAIHGVKEDSGIEGNEDVWVDVTNGNVYPKTPGGGRGDWAGNIYDFIP